MISTPQGAAPGTTLPGYSGAFSFKRFMTEKALAAFQNAYGWKVGVDGSIVVVTVGAGGSIDTDTLTSPVIALIRKV